MKINIQCNCGNKESIDISNGNSDYLEKFTLYSDCEHDTFIECDICKGKIEITIV